MIRYLFFALIPALSAMAADDNLKAFPPAADGMTRHVLNLPEKDNEDDLKVELVVGKTVETDTVNHYFFGGALESKTVDGWGFTYHILPELGPMAGTLVAPGPDTPKEKRFVTLGGEPQLLRYNSRLPLVVYVPNGVEVRYRLWNASGKAVAVDQG